MLKAKITILLMSLSVVTFSQTSLPPVDPYNDYPYSNNPQMEVTVLSSVLRTVNSGETFFHQFRILDKDTAERRRLTDNAVLGYPELINTDTGYTVSGGYKSGTYLSNSNTYNSDGRTFSVFISAFSTSTEVTFFDKFIPQDNSTSSILKDAPGSEIVFGVTIRAQP